jgi:hypothetical protein
MTDLIWIDIDDAAGWLSSKPEDVMCLVREGILGSKRARHGNFVVRGDEVSCLAEFWPPRMARRPRARSRKRGNLSRVPGPGSVIPAQW